MRSLFGTTCRSLALAALPIVVGCNGFTQASLPTDAGSACASALTSTEFDSWFESGSVSLNGAVKPADSVHFPDQPNCTFYKWAEQMFLWLTSPAPPRYGGGGGLVMNTPEFFDVSLPDDSLQRHFVRHTSGGIRSFNLRTAQKGILDLPVVVERKTLRLLEVLPPVTSPAGRPLVLDGQGNEVEVGSAIVREGKPVLRDPAGNEIRAPRAMLRSRTTTSIPPFEAKLERLRDFDRSSLVQKFTLDKEVVFLDLFGHFTETEQGQADGSVLMAQNGSLVYYTLTVNKVFALYRTMQGATVPSNTQFPLTQGDLTVITDFAAVHGEAPVIDSEALAIELKTSWVDAAGLSNADQFIQMKATVPTYDKTTNPNDWAPTGKTTMTLAMVGMHVVGSTGSTNVANANHGHPEMLWATFEHVSNGPAAAYTYTKAPSGTATVAQDTSGTWVFCADGAAAPFNISHISMGGPAPKFDHVVGSPIGPSNILRLMPWGLDGSNANGNAEVLSLNKTVRSLLDPKDVRRNYFHEGTTWTIFWGTPAGGNEVGTNKLENTTMETFNQGSNCFGCHHTNTTAVSHVFDDTAPLF